MIINGVFEGGGVKGNVFVGALCAIEENNISFKNIAGTSAGSIVAALLAAGYTAKEILKIMDETPFSKMMDKTKLSHIPFIGKALSIKFNKGIYKGDFIEEWLDKLLVEKRCRTFGDVSIFGKSTLKILATDLVNKQLIVLPDDLPKYGIIEPMDFSIAKAVRMSISIPLFFTPVQLKLVDKDIYFVDGGVLSNFPIWIFDEEGKNDIPTIGFKIKDSSNDIKSNTNVMNYLEDIVSTMIDKDETVYLKDKDSERTILLDADIVKSTDFKIKSSQLAQLYHNGYCATNKFLNENIDYIKNYKESVKNE